MGAGSCGRLEPGTGNERNVGVRRRRCFTSTPPGSPALTSAPPEPATRGPPTPPGTERRRRGVRAGTAGGAAHARRGPRSVRLCKTSILRPLPGRREASRGRRARPGRGTHQKNTREQRLASCSGLGFTSVCTGSILPGGAGDRAAACAAPGVADEDAGAPAAAPVRSAGTSQATASGNRAPARPDPASRGSSGRQRCVAASSWSPGAAYRLQASERAQGDGARVPDGGRREQHVPRPAANSAGF